MKKILFIIFDGLADRPIPELDNRTPLEVAKIPNLDILAHRGILGTHNATNRGDYPTSEESHFSLFGYDYKKDLPGRGVIEALGLGVPLKETELVLRVNFGTVDGSLNVIDPRAGNIKSIKSFCDYIGEQKIGSFTFKLYPGLAHRGALVISGPAVSAAIRHHSTVVTDTDPHKTKNHRTGNKVIVPGALDTTAESKQTAEALWAYQKLTHKMLDGYVENKVRRRAGHLPANFLLTRGAGFIKPVKSFYEKYHLRAVCVAGAPLYKGVGSYFGMDVINVPGATGGIDTDVSAKVAAALTKLNDGYDFAFLHLKGADVVAEEEGDFEKKIKFLEKADKAFRPLLDFKGLILVTGDHATPCILKDHSEDPVPFLISGAENDNIASFSEKAAALGSVGHLMGWEIMPLLISEANKEKDHA